jgi:hypothetical protein
MRRAILVIRQPATSLSLRRPTNLNEQNFPNFARTPHLSGGCPVSNDPNSRGIRDEDEDFVSVIGTFDIRILASLRLVNFELRASVLGFRQSRDNKSCLLGLSQSLALWTRIFTPVSAALSGAD